jgi:hypothetical protein
MMLTLREEVSNWLLCTKLVIKREEDPTALVPAKLPPDYLEFSYLDFEPQKE